MNKKTRGDQVNARYEEPPSPHHFTGEKLLKNLQAQPGLFHRAATRDVATPEENPEDCMGHEVKHDYLVREPLG